MWWLAYETTGKFPGRNQRPRRLLTALGGDRVDPCRATARSATRSGSDAKTTPSHDATHDDSAAYAWEGLRLIPREDTVVADRYRLISKIGGGPVAASWKVRDEVMDSDCVLKLLHPSSCKHEEALARFKLEDRIARDVVGSYFPQRIGGGSWEGGRYIAWRWYEGESLRTLFERNPRQDAPTVHSLVRDTCAALTELHGAGYAHGDVKPENLFFASGGGNDRTRQLKVLGLGVASRLNRSRRRKGPPPSGRVVGTPLYMSPDVIEGRRDCMAKADLWSLAVVAYEALTGRPPFVGSDLYSVFQAIREKDAPRPSTLASEIPGTFDLWWSRAVSSEFETPEEFSKALRRALAPALRGSLTQPSALLPVPEQVALIESEPGEPSEQSAPKPTDRPSPALAASSGGGTRRGQPETHGDPKACSMELRSFSSVGSVPVLGAAAPKRAAEQRAAEQRATDHRASAETVVEPATPERLSPAKGHPKADRGVVSAEAAPASAPVEALARTLEGFGALSAPRQNLQLPAARRTLVGMSAPVLDLAPAGDDRTRKNKGSSRFGGKSKSSAAPKRSRSEPLAREVAEPPSSFAQSPDKRTLNLGHRDAVRDAVRGPNGTATMPLPRRPRTGRDEEDRSATRVPTSRKPQPAPRTDRKANLVAIAIVCLAALIVIFFLGRAPITGTDSIGRATLSARPESQPFEPSALPEPAKAPQDDSLRESDGTESPVPNHAAETPAATGDERLVSGLEAPTSTEPKDPANHPLEGSTARPAQLQAPQVRAPSVRARAPSRPKRSTSRRPNPQPDKGGADFDFGI